MCADAYQQGGVWDEGNDFKRCFCQLVIITRGSVIELILS